MVDSRALDVRVCGVWDDLPGEFRQRFLARRAAASGEVFYRTSDGRRWEPLRPLVIAEQAYQGLEALSVRLLRLAILDIEEKRAEQRAKEAGKPANERGGAPRLIEGHVTAGWHEAWGEMVARWPDRFAGHI